MASFESMLNKYAELVVRVGVNLQAGQVLILQAPIETAEFTRLIVAKAYAAGAKYVIVDWEDDAVTCARYENAPDDSFDYYPQWLADSMVRFAEEGGAYMYIKVPNPDLFQGIDSSKVSRAVKAANVRERNIRSIRATAKSAGR